MIISPQKIITGDGKSVLVDTAIHIDDTGTITDLASARILVIRTVPCYLV